MSRILKVVDDALEAALRANQKTAAETSAIKEAEAQLRTELARGLHDLAESLRTASVDVTYDDLGGLA